MRAVNTGGGKCAGWKAVLKGEAAFFTGVLCVLFFTFGGPSLLGLSGALLANGLSFAVIFSVMLWLSFGVVRHAECLAEKLGEPYGTLILTLAVISIEVVMITALMLTGAENPTLARDTMFSVLMIVLNGMVGITLLIGGLRHHQQIFNLEGARSYLAVILCLAFICLILPRFTLSGEGGSASPLFYGFLVVASVALYGVFLFLQSTRHRDFFQSPDEVGEGHGGHGAGSTTFHAVFDSVAPSNRAALQKNCGLVGFRLGLAWRADCVGGVRCGVVGAGSRGVGGGSGCARQYAAAHSEYCVGIRSGDDRAYRARRVARERGIGKSH